jgi:hypothetical protein
MSLVCLARFHTLPEAQVVATLLASAGLSPSVFDLHYGGLDWAAQSALGGYRLMLPGAELTDARALLRAPDLALELPEDETPPPVTTGGPLSTLAALVTAAASITEVGWLIAGQNRRTRPSAWEALLGGFMALVPFLLLAAVSVALVLLILYPP